MLRKIKLTITRTRRRTVTLPAATPLTYYCPECGRETETVSKAQAAQILCIAEEAFDTLNTAGKVHTLQTTTNHLLVCKDSLFQDRRNQ